VYSWSRPLCHRRPFCAQFPGGRPSILRRTGAHRTAVRCAPAPRNTTASDGRASHWPTRSSGSRLAGTSPSVQSTVDPPRRSMQRRRLVELEKVKRARKALDRLICLPHYTRCNIPVIIVLFCPNNCAPRAISYQYGLSGTCSLRHYKVTTCYRLSD
jgi:hypothetical protein